MQRELSSLPLPPVHRSKLHRAGFTTVQDVIEVKPTTLSKELGITEEEALDILQLVQELTNKTVKLATGDECILTALEMLRDEQSQQCIITFSEQVDAMLGGGIPLGKMTEFCGAPGIGKTQICLQLAADVHIPRSLGGVAGEAVYIDTEGGLIIERLTDIAKATVTHCQQIATQAPQDTDTLSLSMESVLAGIYYFRCHDYVELVALVHLLPDFIKEHSKVKLVIVDSIAFHFRHDFDDYALRARLLNGLSQNLIRLAITQKLAVVLTNQMTTHVRTQTASVHGELSFLVPALGESWGHASAIRVILHWENRQRYARLYKSPNRPEAVVPYQITTAGIRDIQLSGAEAGASGADLDCDDGGNEQSSKRTRLT